MGELLVLKEQLQTPVGFESQGSHISTANREASWCDISATGCYSLRLCPCYQVKQAKDLLKPCWQTAECPHPKFSFLPFFPKDVVDVSLLPQ